MTPGEWVVAWTAVAVGACVQGSAGFGVAVVAAPILAMLDPVFVPGPMLVCGLALAVAMALRERAALNVAGLGWALVGRLPGTALGAAVVAVLPKRSIGIVLAALVLAAVAANLTSARFAPTTGTLFAAGLAGGFMGTASSIGGPPMALVYQGSRGPELRSTLAGYFAVGTVVSIAALVVVDAFGARELRAAATLLPAVAVGLAASGPVSKVLDKRHTRSAVLGMSAVSAIALLVQTLV